MNQEKLSMANERLAQMVAEEISAGRYIVGVEAASHYYKGEQGFVVTIGNKPSLRAETLKEAIECREAILDIFSQTRVARCQ